MLPDILYVADSSGAIGEFRRTGPSRASDPSVFRSPSILTSANTPVNEFLVRTSISGSPKDPSKFVKRHNLLYHVQRIGTDGIARPYKASLTLEAPAGGVVDATLLQNVMHRTLGVALEFGSITNDETGSGTGVISTPEWPVACLMQEL